MGENSLNYNKNDKKRITRKTIIGTFVGLVFGIMTLTGCEKKEAEDLILRKMESLDIEDKFKNGEFDTISEDMKELIGYVEADLAKYDNQGSKINKEDKEKQTLLQIYDPVLKIYVDLDTIDRETEYALDQLKSGDKKKFNLSMLIAIIASQDIESAKNDLKEHKNKYENDDTLKEYANNALRKTGSASSKVKNVYNKYFTKNFQARSDELIKNGKPGLTDKEISSLSKKATEELMSNMPNFREKYGITDETLATLDKAFDSDNIPEITKALGRFSEIEKEILQEINEEILKLATEEAEKKAMEVDGEEEQNSSENNQTNNSGNVVTDALQAAGEGIGKGAQAAGEGIGKGAQAVGEAGGEAVHSFAGWINDKVGKTEAEDAMTGIAEKSETADYYLQMAEEAKANGDGEGEAYWRSKYDEVAQGVMDRVNNYKNTADTVEERRNTGGQEPGE